MKTIFQSVADGLPLQVPFIDVHGHLGPWPETTGAPAGDPRRVVAEMDRYGCDMVWMTAATAGADDDTRANNDRVFDLAAQFPDRIIPYCTLPADRPEQMTAELVRCLGRGRCIGAKLHAPAPSACELRDARIQPVLEMLQHNRLVLLKHTFADLADLRWALAKYPDLVFISGQMSRPINELAHECQNLYVCTCDAYLHDHAEELAATGRADRLLVGSDFSLFYLGFGVGVVGYTAIPEPDKVSILGGNALRLLERMPWFGELRLPGRE
jgi:predicted TIM-barrel fold metal-dependent hydrolase